MKGERKLTKEQRVHVRAMNISTVEGFRTCLANQKKRAGIHCPECDAIAQKLGIIEG